MNFNDNVFKLIYGHDVDIKKIKEIKNTEDIWNDILLYLCNNDISKIKEIKEMKALDVLNILNSKLLEIPKLNNNKINKVGYK